MPALSNRLAQQCRRSSRLRFAVRSTTDGELMRPILVTRCTRFSWTDPVSTCVVVRDAPSQARAIRIGDVWPVDLDKSCSSPNPTGKRRMILTAFYLRRTPPSFCRHLHRGRPDCAARPPSRAHVLSMISTSRKEFSAAT